MGSYGSIGAFMFCEQDYPRRLAFAALGQSLALFEKQVGDNWKKFKKDENIPVEGIEEILKNYQDPAKLIN